MNWTKYLTSANVLVYKLSNGRVGSRLGKQSVLLLNTTGRRTGKHYSTSLSYYRDGETYLLVASNWGKESNPAWYLNLMQQPRTTIQVGSQIIPVEAHTVTPEEYGRLWDLIAGKNKQYNQYQMGMKRRIPIVRLVPLS